ncbi:IclR family transcriptional regulator [Kribbella sp. NPDC003505]|uniref:IclR family transcriptional regulator n=1 Tax=Kribbella sp. NPDC003505 TaxID=3154448 RepID=UPI0033B09AAD
MRTGASAEESGRAHSPAVDRTLSVLETLVRADSGMTLTALSKATAIPLATCASIAYSLERRGYASRRIVGRSHFWKATMALYGLAVQLTRNVDLATVAQEEMQEVADALHMPVHVGVLNGASLIYVAKASSPGFIQFDTYPGKMLPFNLTALGRAIAAHLPESELEPLLSGLVPGHGPKAGSADGEQFLVLLEQVRRYGYAVEDEEDEANIGCVAVPFFDAGGHVAGAVGVTALSAVLDHETVLAVATRLRSLAALFSDRLGDVRADAG